MESKICRVCLDRTAIISLFELQDNMQYREKLMKCVTVVIEEGDGLPDSICESCASELALSYEFAQKCVASDRALRCLGLLQAPDLKEEKLEVKLESTVDEYTEELTEYDDDPDQSLRQKYSNEITEYDKSMVHKHTKKVTEYVKDSNLPVDPKNTTGITEYNDGPDQPLVHEFSKEVAGYYEDPGVHKQRDVTDDDPDHQHSKPEIENHVKRKGTKKSKKCLPDHLRKNRHKVYSGPIQCMVCCRVLRCQSAYDLHMRTHTKEKPFSCDLCHKCFRNKSSMKAHINRHYGINNLELRKNKPLPDWDGRKNKKKSPPVLCVVCGLKLNCHSALDTHMRSHTGEKPFSCQDCDKSYSSKGSLRRHIEMNHNKSKSLRFICEHCGKNFYSKTNIIIHLRIHTGERPYSCPFCPERFVQISSLNRHKRCHTGERPYACQRCPKAFRDKSLLNKHQAVHTEARDFICHICSKGFKTKAALRSHIDRHNNPEKFICNFCGTAFTVKGNLNIHVKRMHSEKSGICTVCHKSFPNIPAHMRFHTGEKPYTCKLCNQGFATQRTLTHHIGFKHRDAAKFKCTTGQCDKAFPLISMLEFHVLKAHLDTTPYICQHCARGFLRPCDLSRHLKMNHMETTHLKSQFIKTIQIDNA